ncbi:MAG: nodulation protein NfeD, partial [Gammaproteobacteria bacterium]|nr:nodulation protein NfeD [Gammaproteobacteria bacterium]
MRYCAIVAGLLVALLSHAAHAEGTVVELELKGGIGVATADYIISGIEHAEETGAELIIINMDTPGGLMAPMRDIVQEILGSGVPVATYVTPAGARADSAGTYILLASHIAVMAPTTHLGAATPVALTGDDATPNEPDDADDDAPGADKEPGDESQPGTSMERKVLNDAIAYIRGLADRYGRNADWAEDAVVNAATLTATDALEQNVIEFIAVNRSDLLKQVNGYEVEIDSETVTLDTSEVIVEVYEPNWRIKILSAIANPEIVLLLGLIGLYGLM